MDYLQNAWSIFVGLFWWALNRITAKIDDLEKGKASSDDLSGVRHGLSELDKRVDDIDHATQLRLVPRSEYKQDVTSLHVRISDVAEKLCSKEDRIKTIRVSDNENKKGK
jgi:septation ring formation regulator EzrA